MTSKRIARLIEALMDNGCEKRPIGLRGCVS